MSKLELSNQIDCASLSSDEINFEVKNLLFNKHKQIVLKNTFGKNNLLEGLKNGSKIEIIEAVGSGFANGAYGTKFIVNGDVGNDSGNSVENCKIVIYGSCSDNFGNAAKKSDFYIFGNCGRNSFFDSDNSSRIIVGGQVNSGFASQNNGGIIVALNLQGGNIYIEDDYFNSYKDGNIYFRSEKNKIKVTSSRFLLKEVNEEDEDIYLPLISEFARLFGYSLNEIKSKPFYKVMVK